MKRVLLLLLLLLSLSSIFSVDEEMLVVSYIVDGENIFSVEDIFLMTGVVTESLGEEYDYIFQTLNFEGDLVDEIKIKLHEISFAPDSEWFDEDGNQIYVRDVAPLLSYGDIYIPYDTNLEYLLILNNVGDEIDRINLPSYLGYDDDLKKELGLDEKYFEQQFKEVQESNSSFIFCISLLIFFLILFGFYFYFRKK